MPPVEQVQQQAEGKDRPEPHRPGGVVRELPKQHRAHNEFLKQQIEATRKQLDRGLTLKEKVAGARTFFGSLEEWEKAKGGRTHYRVVLSFDRPATNGEIRDLTNGFLGENFPKAMAFPAIHRDTDHPHVHIYIHSRQIDSKRINLRNEEFRRLDEGWAKRYGDWVNERKVYEQHLEKTLETLAGNGRPSWPESDESQYRRRELARADARAKELTHTYTATYNEKAPPAMLNRKQNELINKGMWVIKDEDARHRLSFEGRDTQLVYDRKDSKTHEREQAIKRDTYSWDR